MKKNIMVLALCSYILYIVIYIFSFDSINMILCEVKACLFTAYWRRTVKLVMNLYFVKI